ncbi:hypothetical protein [Nonomuraea basaltis]|nr:hypothetical protein [Nonomuraea basaltis]
MSCAYALIDRRERAFQLAFIEGPPPLGPGAEDALGDVLEGLVG